MYFLSVSLQQGVCVLIKSGLKVIHICYIPLPFPFPHSDLLTHTYPTCDLDSGM
jgi:hypothetical protein